MRTDENGNIIIDEEFGPVVRPVDEIKNFVKRAVYDFFGLLILIIGLPIIYILNRIFPIKNKKVMIGTIPIVSNVHFKEMFKNILNEKDVDIFIFQDWLGEKSYYDLTVHDVLPKWLIGKDPYAIAPYFILLWAYRRYSVFSWYLDSAFLERTFLWRIEPFLLDIFNKKVIIRAYGADEWSLLQVKKLVFKIGLMSHRRRYFLMDIKKIKRMYMWSKYADVINGDVRYLPRVKSFVFGNNFIELEKLTFNLNEKFDPVIIAHFANHAERKGSNAIKGICEELKREGYNIEYKEVIGVSREEALAILEESHIFISNIMHGDIDTAVMEGMAKGNVVLCNFDREFIEAALIYNYEYYGKFFDKLPIINVNVFTLKEELVKLITNKELLKRKIMESRKYVEESVKRVESTFNKNHYVLKMLKEAD